MTKLPEFFVDNELKTTFVNELKNKGYSESQCNVSISFLKKVDQYEHMNGLPVYKYTSTGLIDMLRSFNSNSLTSIKTMFTVIKTYILFSNEYLNNTNGNIGIMSITNNDLESLVSNLGKYDKYLTYKEYMSIINIRSKEGYSDINYQDLVFIVLLWNGIKGKDYSDIVNYTIDKYDGDNGCLIGNNGELIYLNKDECNVIEQCINEETYTYYEKFNKGGERREVKLNMSSKMLLKPSDHHNSSNTVSSNNLKVRLIGFSNRIKKPSLTGVSIYSSGCMYRALEKYSFNKNVTCRELDESINAYSKNIAYVKLEEIKNIMLDKIERE